MLLVFCLFVYFVLFFKVQYSLCSAKTIGKMPLKQTWHHGRIMALTWKLSRLGSSTGNIHNHKVTVREIWLFLFEVYLKGKKTNKNNMFKSLKSSILRQRTSISTSSCEAIHTTSGGIIEKTRHVFILEEAALLKASVGLGLMSNNL